MFNRKILISDRAVNVAKIIVDKCLRYGEKINIVKLQKMMIISYGEYLLETGKKLFSSKIVVEKGTLTIPELEYELKNNGAEFKETFNTDYMLLSDEMLIIQKVINRYSNKSIAEFNNDPRLVELARHKKIIKTISDKTILNVFTTIPKPEIKTHLLCSASEKGKWIINGCLKAGYAINTFKLEKLLVLFYGEYLAKTGKKLFNEDMVIWKVGPMIKEVDRDFLPYAIKFDAQFFEYYPMLEAEEQVLKSILFKYGNMDGFELNENVKLKELVNHKDSDGFVSDEDIKSVFEKYL